MAAGFVHPCGAAWLRQRTQNSFTISRGGSVARQHEARVGATVLMSSNVDGSQRRAFLRNAALSAAAVVLGDIGVRPEGEHPWLIPPAHAEAGLLTDEVIEETNYRLRVPAGFSRNNASLKGGRILTIFTSESDKDSNITIAEIPVQADYQKLTSFGSLENVLENLVPSRVAGNAVLSATLDPKKNAYLIEYKMQPRGSAGLKHLYTVFSLKPGEAIITITAQTADANWENMRDTFLAVANSYELKQ